MSTIRVGNRVIGEAHPTYFIADIAANHDGDLERAKALIHLAKKAGADAAKFQNFRAAKIVSDRGFRELGGQQSHQSTWKKSVFEVYKGASVPWEWTAVLKAEAAKAGIDYFSTPYDLETVAMLDPFVDVFKIGSGDITWPEMLAAVASTGKPVLLASGAANLGDVQRAMAILQANSSQICLMQCNTNYTGTLENLRFVNLNVLKTFAVMYPDVVLGLSDHTPKHATVLGSVALGARVIEKHFTDDNKRVGPDHHFSMAPSEWREMVERTRELEAALGSGNKRIEPNEQETVVIQRRSVRAVHDLPAGTVISREMFEALRPAPADAVFPYDLESVLGKVLTVDLPGGQYLKRTMLREA